MDLEDEPNIMWRKFRLKGYSLLFLLCCVVLTSVTFIFPSNLQQKPTIHTIVSETQHQLDNLKKNFDEQRMKVDKAYLDLLGLPVHKDDVIFDPSDVETQPLPARKSLTRPRPFIQFAGRHDAGRQIHRLLFDDSSMLLPLVRLGVF